MICRDAKRILAKRIMVIGCGGAGKSTFARKLASVLDLPVLHLDAFYWRPGWIEPPPAEWEETVRNLASREAWVMDGNYGGTMDLRLARAEVVVFMDFSRTACLWGVVKRRFRFAGRSRPDMAPGCPERLDRRFVKYIWNYRKTRRPGVLRKLRGLPEGKRAFVLRSRREAEEFL